MLSYYKIYLLLKKKITNWYVIMNLIYLFITKEKRKKKKPTPTAGTRGL